MEPGSPSAQYLGVAQQLGARSPIDARFAAALLARDVLPAEQLRVLIEQAASERRPLQAVVAASGAVTDTLLAEISATVSGVGFVSIDDFRIAGQVLAVLPQQIAASHGALPISVEDRDGRPMVTVALANPASAPARHAVQQYLLSQGKEVTFVAASPERVTEIIRARYGTLAAIDRDEPVENPEADLDASSIADEINAGPARQHWNQILEDAVAMGASDIHLEVGPDGRNLLARGRVDGVMREITEVPERYRAAVMSVVKLQLEMDVADQRKLKNGRVSKKIDGRTIDLRGANWVTVKGEEMVIRILDQGSRELSIDNVGFTDYNRERFVSGYERSSGAIVICGPTGSGKSSTLYATMAELIAPERTILTIEDPVEYQMAGISQAPVRPDLGRDFADCLRNALRCDPDVIMVGEVRDRETAEISMRAAISGHLVLTTLHSMEAAAAPFSLYRMGAPWYVIADALSVIVGQRLCRVLCDSCRTARIPSVAELGRLGVSEQQAQQIIANADRYRFHDRGDGCSACGGQGFRGRTALHEVLVMGDAERDLLVSEQRSIQALRRLAMRPDHPAGPMHTLKHDALQRVASGVTSIAEALRVVS